MGPPCLNTEPPPHSMLYVVNCNVTLPSRSGRDPSSANGKRLSVRHSDFSEIPSDPQNSLCTSRCGQTKLQH